MALHFFVNDLVVRDGRFELAVPVDQAVAPVDESVAEEAEESLPHGPGADGVHGEALALPVAGAAHGLLLTDDAFPVFVLPGLDAGDEAGPAEVVAGLVFELEEALFDDGLGADPGVVRARHPQGVIAHHAVPADEEVLHDVVHGVAHVQGPGDVGQGHHDDVALGAPVGDGGEGVRGRPFFINPLFVLGGFVKFRDFLGHDGVLWGKNSLLLLPQSLRVINELGGIPADPPHRRRPGQRKGPQA